MFEKLSHIFDYMEGSDFNFSEVGTKFNNNTLVVYYHDQYITIEDFFSIMKTRKVKLSDFK